MPKRQLIQISRTHPAAVTSCVFMSISAILRLSYYLPTEQTAFFTLTQIILPLAANILFITAILLENRLTVPLSITSVVLGVALFIIKAAEFAPLHRTLCTILYITVLTLYTLTVARILPTKKLLYPLFGLPLAYHIFIEDTQLYFFADPPVPVWDWLPEISVLCIMAALLSQVFVMKTELK